jgi:hypothetical protein
MATGAKCQSLYVQTQPSLPWIGLGFYSMLLENAIEYVYRALKRFITFWLSNITSKK